MQRLYNHIPTLQSLIFNPDQTSEFILSKLHAIALVISTTAIIGRYGFAEKNKIRLFIPGRGIAGVSGNAEWKSALGGKCIHKLGKA